MAGELDQDAESYKAKWQARLRLSDQEALGSYMRSVASDAEGYAKLDDARRDQTYLSIRVDGRGLDAAADPGAIGGMVAEWQARIDAERPADPRSFTKRAIVEAVGRHIHLEEEIAPLVGCAAVWIAAQDRRVGAALRQGDVTLYVTFTFDEITRTQRMRLEIGYAAEDVADPGADA